MIASVPARRAQHAQELRPRGQPCRLRISLMDCCEHPRGRGGAKTTESVWTISPDQSRAPRNAQTKPPENLRPTGWTDDARRLSAFLSLPCRSKAMVA